MKIYPFKSEHLAWAELQPPERAILEAHDASVLEGHIGGTFVKDDTIVAFAGVVLMSDKTGEVWVVPTMHIEKVRFAFPKWLAWYIEAIGRLYDLRWVQSGCEDNEKRRRFLEWLGFEPVDGNLYRRELL